MHPLINDASELTESQLEERLSNLQRKYLSSHDPHMQHQLMLAIDTYREEHERRTRKKFQQDQDNDLDNLINVS